LRLYSGEYEGWSCVFRGVEPIGLIIPVYYQKFGGLAECWATWSFPDTEYLKNGIGYRWDEDEEELENGDIILTVIKVKKKGELH
jgi:hypothetical protein